MVFVADDFGAWLVALLADAGRKKLTTLVLGSEQERALGRAATAAVQRTAAQLASSDGQQAEQLAMVIGEVFGGPASASGLAGQVTLLQALEAGIIAEMAVLDDPGLTGTGQSSAQTLGVPSGVIAEALAGHLIGEIKRRGSGGGPLAPLADQLNHDMTHLQGQRMEGMLTRLDDRVTALAQAGSATLMTVKPVRLLPRPTSLAGRRDLLADLDIRLAGGDGQGPRVVVLYGLGGAGKTSVALEYAHRHLPEARVVWQLRAGDTTVLAAGFGELAAQLGVHPEAEGGDPVASVHAALAAHPGWLLVFDDAPDSAAVRQFLPPAGDGQVLITSRNALWPPGQAVEVPVLDLDVAAGFLAERSGDPDRQAAEDLADELGGLPLALEQAAAYVQATVGSLAGYVVLFRSRRHDLLGRGEPAGYDKTVATTWALAFAELEQSAPGAAALLRLLAFCAPDAVPLRLLLQPRPGIADDLSPQVAEMLVPLLEDELAAGDAIAVLRRYSLARPAGDRAVSVHPLVQAVTIGQMPADLAETWRRAAAELIEAAIPGNPRQHDTWPAFAAIFPHAGAALDAGSDGMERVAGYLGSSGSYAGARDLFQRVLAARERALGPASLATLATRASVAHWTGQAGDPAAARDQFAALLPVIERVLDPQDPMTLHTRANLARWTGRAGDAAAARDQFAGLLPVTQRVLGAEHSETLTVCGNLARWTGEAGDPAAARDQLMALLPLRERVSGPDHFTTLVVRGNLARWTGEAGDPAAARDQLAALLPIRETISGLDHPATLTARANLARWTGKAGDPGAARDQLMALLPVRESVSGPKHPDTLAVRADIARWTRLARGMARTADQGSEGPGTRRRPGQRRARHAALYARLLPEFDQILGPEHPDTLAVRAGLASSTSEAGDRTGACDQFAALLPVVERVLGPEHPLTLDIRAGLARWTGSVKDAAGARDQFAALLPLFERVLGLEHPQTLYIRHSVARWTGQAGDPGAARDQYAALLPVRERVLGPEHPDTRVARNNLAYWTKEASSSAH